VKLLLDTHAFLWFLTGDDRLGRRARRALEACDAEL
jgi:PIN domain nuclease of toxin-antitoxin system